MHQSALVAGLVYLAALLAAPSSAHAQTEFVGGDIQCNAYTTGFRSEPDVSMAGDGSFVVVWSGVGDGDDYGIFGRTVDAQGVPSGDEISINTTTGGTQNKPAVGADSQGNFSVAWTDRSGSDGSGWGVFGRSFTAAGSALDTDEFLAAQNTQSTQNNASVGGRGGGFVIAWETYLNYSPTDVGVRRFQAASGPLGDEGLYGMTQFALDPAVGRASDGRFVVVWQDYDGTDYFNPPTNETLSRGISGQLFDGDGVPVGSEFRVNTNTRYNQSKPEVDMAGDGSFVVVWQGGWANTVSGRRFDADGNPLDVLRCDNDPTAECTTDGDCLPSQCNVVGRCTTAPTQGCTMDVECSSTGGTCDFTGRCFSATGQDCTSNDDCPALCTASEFSLHGPLAFPTSNPDVAIGGDGGFLSVFQVRDFPGATGSDAVGSYFDSSGEKIVDDFVINENRAGQQTMPRVASNQLGQFAVAFLSDTTITARLIDGPDGTLCGDADGNGTITATDALFVLTAAVGAGVCDPAVCDVDGSGSVTATDALAVLQAAVGGEGLLNCL